MKPGSPAQKLVLSQSTKRAKASATIRRLLVQFDPTYNTYTRSTEVQDAYNALAPKDSSPVSVQQFLLSFLDLHGELEAFQKPSATLTWMRLTKQLPPDMTVYLSLAKIFHGENCTIDQGIAYVLKQLQGIITANPPTTTTSVKQELTNYIYTPHAWS